MRARSPRKAKTSGHWDCNPYGGSKDKRIMKHTDLKINLSQCLLSLLISDEYVRI